MNLSSVKSRLPTGLRRRLGKIWRHFGGGGVEQHRAEATSEVISDYERRVAKEKQNFSNCLDVHALPEIFHYWSHKYLGTQKLAPFGITDPEQFFFLYSQKFHARFPENPSGY